MIQEKILELTEYGLVTGLAAPEDKRFTINLPCFLNQSIQLNTGYFKSSRRETWDSFISFPNKATSLFFSASTALIVL